MRISTMSKSVAAGLNPVRSSFRYFASKFSFHIFKQPKKCHLWETPSQREWSRSSLSVSKLVIKFSYWFLRPSRWSCGENWDRQSHSWYSLKTLRRNHQVPCRRRRHCCSWSRLLRHRWECQSWHCCTRLTIRKSQKRGPATGKCQF